MPLKASVTAFCPASVDTFSVKAPLLGDLTHIKLSHDAKGAHPDWLVELVRIVHVESKQEWLFFGHVWLHSGNANQVTLTPGWFPEGSCTMLRCACCAVPHCKGSLFCSACAVLLLCMHSDWRFGQFRRFWKGLCVEPMHLMSGYLVSTRLICPRSAITPNSRLR